MSSEKAQQLVQDEIANFEQQAVDLALCAAILRTEAGSGNVVDHLREVTVEALRERLGGLLDIADLTGGSHLQGLLGVVGDTRRLEEVRTQFRGPCVFGDYTGQDLGDGKILLPGATPGQAVTEWCVGLTPTEKPVWLSFEHAEPHLLIGGSNGSGKSTVMHSMLLQMMGNNTPDDLEVWMLAPKHELQIYAGKPHVRRFEDVATATSAYDVAAKMFADLVAEKDRRLALLRETDAANLRDARKAGALDLPYILMVVEECSSFFAPPAVAADPENTDKASMKELIEQHRVLMHYVSEMARQGRAAGMHMVFATQAAYKDAFPATLKRNCQRIGLRTMERLSSLMIIDRAGLEKLEAPGLCMVTDPYGGSEFINTRAFYIAGDEPDPMAGGLPEAA